MNYRINLLPPELQPRPLVDRKRLVTIAGLTMLLGLFLMGGAGWLIKSYNQRSELASINGQLSSLSPTVQKVEQIRAQKQKLLASAAAMEELLSRHRAWKPVMDDMARILPVDMWLVSVDAAYNQDADKVLKTSAGASTANPPGAPGNQAAGTPGSVTPGAGVNPVTGTPAGGASPVQKEGKDKIPPPPNVLTLKGVSRSFPSIGVFVRKLSDLSYFSQVTLQEVSSREDGTLSFTVICYLQPVEKK
ncbi:MAG TPA: hypothetical protein GXX25_00400 [Desulfotomaculum sp.]|nr:hypothetical protein [Desulfotomaculum sp.]